MRHCHTNNREIHKLRRKPADGQLACNFVVARGTKLCSGACRACYAAGCTMQATFSRARTVNVQAKESRIGMKAITVPKGVTIKLQGQSLSVKASDGLDGRRSRKQHHARLIVSQLLGAS